MRRNRLKRKLKGPQKGARDNPRCRRTVLPSRRAANLKRKRLESQTKLVREKRRQTESRLKKRKRKETRSARRRVMARTESTRGSK